MDKMIAVRRLNEPFSRIETSEDKRRRVNLGVLECKSEVKKCAPSACRMSRTYATVFISRGTDRFACECCASCLIEPNKVTVLFLCYRDSQNLEISTKSEAGSGKGKNNRIPRPRVDDTSIHRRIEIKCSSINLLKYRPQMIRQNVTKLSDLKTFHSIKIIICNILRANRRNLTIKQKIYINSSIIFFTWTHAQ